MLHQFLLAERSNILSLCAKKLAEVSDARSSSAEMDVGLPIFYDELIEVLRLDEEEALEDANRTSGTVHRASAMRRGKESLKLGYTVSQVVHGYGALCQAITEYAGEHAERPIEPREFNRLNFCLDVAIAEAVTEFTKGQQDSTARAEALRLGFLAHELRNALANAAMAHQMMKKGIVGLGGSTNQLLESALSRMKDIIDRSLAEVRLQGDPIVELQRCRVIDMVGEVEATAMTEAHNKLIRLYVEVPSDLIVLADRHLLVSAISNLVQNAIKFTKPDGNVWIRGRVLGEQVLIEVEDQCGGLPPGKLEELFQPFVQKGVDRSGLGLGLSISRRAASLNDGQISVRDLPGKGCVFTISLPKVSALPGESEGLVVGIH